ncbi:MAG TPA: polysaccharide biosynthesis/export family protein [Hyphomonadaceae bacterium]|nr:polysaccharide biosynthesis/export family protein [Hyphomonadaceae bacterium]HPI46904.1 polysaccharide biosynthesis/export family protein [Hyphomonadaceae bacterium]HPN07117.1 polysaccharide biosynthesis/export family protein [Hyphomonadaceae bacterium]
MALKNFLRLQQLAVLSAFVWLGACATEPSLPQGNGAYSVETGHEYKLGPGDKIRVTVFGEDALSGEFLVANNGSVSLPLVGQVRAGGSTLTNFETAIQEQLTASGMVRSPKVSADMVEYRPYYILGEVNKPGQYTYSIGLTVTKAVATAGGFTYRADNKIVYVTREGAQNEAPVPVTAATWIGPGDTLRIGERMF